MQKRIKKIIITTIISGFLSVNSFAYQELIIRNYGNKPVRVIKIVLDGQHYVVSSIAGTGGESLESLTKKIGGTTSLNGVFFCPEDYTNCNVTHTISERVFLGEGKAYSRYRGDTGIRGIFGFDNKGEPLFVQKNLGYMTGLQINFNENRLNDIYFGLGNFPVLLYHGNDLLRGSEADIDHKIRAKVNKHFICSNKEGDIIYMGAVGGMGIYEFPAYIKKYFNCYNALLLDAGYSAGMIYEGDVLQRAKRTNIMDAFVVLTREQYKTLTNTNPPNKTPYHSNKYKLTINDLRFIKKIEKIIAEILKNKPADYKRKIIKIFRKAISSPRFQSKQDQARFSRILHRMYIIDKL